MQSSIQKNLSTKEAKALLLKAIGGELQNLSDHLKSIKNRKNRMDALIKLLGYVLPKQTFLELDDDTVSRSWIEAIDLTILAEQELKLMLSAFYNQKNEHINSTPTED